MFAYSKNNPVNMEDADGDRPAYIGETASDVQASVAATSRMLSKTRSVANRYSSSSFDYAASAFKNTQAAVGDKAGSRTAVRVAKKWAAGALATVKLVEKPTVGEIIKSKALGAVSSITFTSKDVITSVSNKQYVGACMDLVSGAAGIGAGMILEGIGEAIIAAAVLPELAVGAGVVLGGIVIGVGIDYAEDRIKKEYYRGK